MLCHAHELTKLMMFFQNRHARELTVAVGNKMSVGR